jgi:hypothetical protein
MYYSFSSPFNFTDHSALCYRISKHSNNKMISIRSMIAAGNKASSLLAKNGQFLPAMSSSSTVISTHLVNAATTSAPTTTPTRQLTSPAYRRHLQKQRGGSPTGLYYKGKTAGALPPKGQPVVVEIGSAPRIPAEQPGTQVPTLAIAKALPNGYSEMDNVPLLAVAEMGNHGARIELLKRHIMAVDGVDYETAGKKFLEIKAKAREGIFLSLLPYKISIAAALSCAIGSWPMVFDETTSLWFNHHFVTMEIPEPSDMDTWLEVGAWTWNWNEPVLGTASFVLLCLQFAR